MRSPDASVPLAPLTTLGVGGPAEWFVEAATLDDVREACAWARHRDCPLTVLAGGSNVVIADAGIAGLVLHLRTRGVSARPEGDDVLVTAAAGEAWDDLVAWSVREGLSGIECLSGIPGTVGGTPIQNVGAYGQEVASTIEGVTIFDRDREECERWDAAQCGFSYRSSRFKQRDRGRFIVCDVTFRLGRRPPTLRYPDLQRQLLEGGVSSPTLAEVRAAVLTVRRRKGMVIDPADPDTRSVGSFFTNPVVPAGVAAAVERRAGAAPPVFPAGEGLLKLPAAWLLQHAGFRPGDGDGRVGLSSKHTLAIVNRGGATAAEVLAFAAQLSTRVSETFGIDLVPEPTFLGFPG